MDVLASFPVSTPQFFFHTAFLHIVKINNYVQKNPGNWRLGIEQCIEGLTIDLDEVWPKSPLQ